MATWDKKTYKMVADRLTDAARFASPSIRDYVSGLAQNFADQFGKDDPAFDRDKFYKAVFGERARRKA